MLSMQMKSGDYVTIGENIVVQVFKESGPQFRISIKAPREVPIVRGKVLERSGNQRPEGLRDKLTRKSPSDLAHAARQKQRLMERQAERQYRSRMLSEAMEGMNKLLDRMDNDVSLKDEISCLRDQMEKIFHAGEALKLSAGITGSADPEDARAQKGDHIFPSK